MSGVAVRLRSVLDDAVEVYAGTDGEQALREARARLDEPLRVAIAGRVKAGKSTLLNALVGERIAPTDAGECTRIVTWYRHGHTSRAVLEANDGDARAATLTRNGSGAIDVDLGGSTAAEIRRIVVDWPSSRLSRMTLIDTPGVSSLTTDASARTVRFLTPDDEDPGEADAVVYLLRHVHADDVRFLEAFHDRELAQPTPVNALGVLSRADEIGVCRLDAMDSAARIAGRLDADHRIRRLCQRVVPVAGLLAQAAATLTEDHVAVLRTVAGLVGDTREDLLLSTDRFVADRDDLPVVAAHRAQVLEDLGWFGVRFGVQTVLEQPATTASGLAALLRTSSGIERLRTILGEQLADRADVLKARSAALALDVVLQRAPVEGSDLLESRLEEVLAAAHDYAELRLLNLLRRGAVTLSDADLVEAEVLLGAAGASARARLGLSVDTTAAEVAAVAAQRLVHWRRRAENPLSDRSAKDACAVLVRTCEGIAAQAALPTSSP